MPVMTAADLMALARKNTPGARPNDPTVKFSTQQRQMRRQAQIKKDRLTPKPESSPKVKPEPMDIDMDDAKPAAGSYTDYTIYSKVIDGETLCLMRFKAPNPNDPVDITHMPGPFRLNRKNPKAKLAGGDDPTAIKEPTWRVLRAPDGREIIGKDGKPVMGATVEGKEILQVNWGKEREKMTKAELEAKKKKAPFKKKTRQVYSANPDSRNDPQERFPWVFESAGDKDSWTGRKQNFDDGSFYGILAAVPGHAEAMQFISVPLRYDFVMTKTHAATKSAEAAEAELADVMKRGSLLYQMNRRANGSASAAALATISGEGASGSTSGPGVKKEEEEDGGGLFGSDDESGPKREKGDGGDVDEMDFEEEHADDEDNVEPEEMEDDDLKASKARIKREQIAANKTIDAGVDDDEDDDDDALTREGRRMKRALKKQGMGYDSDDEDAQNPYASSEDDDDDDDGFLFRPPPTSEPATAKSETPPPGSNASGSRSTTPKPRANSKGPTPGAPPTKDKSSKDKAKEKSSTSLKVPPSIGSRASSPIPGVSGAAVVAQRATSPAPKKGNRPSTPSGGNKGGRASSPLAGGAGSRANSPTPAAPSPLGAGRPAASSGKGRTQSPMASGPSAGAPIGSPLKRKAMDDTASAVSPTAPTTISPSKDHVKKKIKKAGAGPSAGGPPTSSPAPSESFPGIILESEVMSVLREHPSGIVSTALIALFRKRFVDEPRNKKVLSSIVKRVANSVQVKDGNSYLLTAKSGP